MQKNKITIISRSKDHPAGLAKQSQEFVVNQMQIIHSNKIDLQEQLDSRSGQIRIVNSLCEKKNDRLYKSIYIYFENKVIKIEDQFYLKTSTDTVKVEGYCSTIKMPIQSKISENCHTLKQQTHTDKKEEKKKRDVKNIVKNIVKLFINWLQKVQKYDKCKKVLFSLINTSKFNNTLIRTMSLNPQINFVFILFADHECQQMIQSSRIHDKNSHIQAIKKYFKLFKENEKSASCSSTRGNQSIGNNISLADDQDDQDRNIEGHLSFFSESSKKQTSKLQVLCSDSIIDENLEDLSNDKNRYLTEQDNHKVFDKISENKNVKEENWMCFETDKNQ